MESFLIRKNIVIIIVFLFIATILVSGNTVEVTITKPKQFSINNGLVGYWSFDEISDNIVPDESENDNDGAISGAIEKTGISGLAIEFDGVNDEVIVPNDSSLNFHNTNQFSISLWVKREGSLKEKTEALISKGTLAHQEGYNLYILTNDTLLFGIRDGSSSYFDASNTEIGDSNWHHIVVAWDGTTKFFYIDGELDKSVLLGEITIADDSKPLEFAAHWGYMENNNPFHGTIDEVRIYDRVLSKNEIKELYSNPGALVPTFIFGKISALETGVGNLMILKAEKLRVIEFSPFQFLQFTSGEKIKISEQKLGIVTPTFVFGVFKASI
jgi:hypothetical protein